MNRDVIQSAQVDQEVQAKLYESLTQTIQRELRKSSEQQRIDIPLGSVFDSKLLADKDPTSP